MSDPINIVSDGNVIAGELRERAAAKLDAAPGAVDPIRSTLFADAELLTRAAAKIDRLSALKPVEITDEIRGLLMSASRYVEGYADNENNHPQARDGARSLLTHIRAALTAVLPRLSAQKEGWRTIDSAPKDGEPIILFARHINATASVPVIGFYLEERGGWVAQAFMGQGIARLIPSHWMPRPKFPVLSTMGDMR